MKKGFIIALILLCLPAALYSEKAAEVFLRYSKQDNLVKVVLEGSDNIIGSTNTITSASGVRLGFPSAYDLKKPKDFIFETSGDNRTLMILLKDVSDVRTYKLTSPARIVIEMKVKSQDTGQKQQKDAVQQTAKTPAQTQTAQKAAEPAKPADKTTKFNTVVIDPGHGGYDYGIYRQDVKEKEINLSMAKDLSAALQKKGIKVFMTRKADQPLSLGERINLINSKSPDIFISLHATSGSNFVISTAAPDDSGSDPATRAYRLSARQGRHLEKSRSAANAFSEAVKNELKIKSVRRELPLPVLNSADTTAVLIEYPITSLKLSEQKDRDRIINALLKGLAAHE